MILLFIDLVAHTKFNVGAAITDSRCAAKHCSNPESFILDCSQATKDIQYVWTELQSNVYEMGNLQLV